MEREISNIAMLGIVLLAVAIIIGLGFGVFSVAKGTANEGVVNMQDSLTTVSASIFNDYDQKIVTGNQVISAYKNFEGKPYAILVATRAFLSGEQPANSAIQYMTGTGTNKYVARTNLQVKNNKAQDVELQFINYNALLTNTGANSLDLVLKFENGYYVTNNGFATTNGVIDFNNISGGMSRSGNAEFIPSSARFQANLVKDSSGTIMGIAFQQIGSI